MDLPYHGRDGLRSVPLFGRIRFAQFRVVTPSSANDMTRTIRSPVEKSQKQICDFSRLAVQ